MSEIIRIENSLSEIACRKFKTDKWRPNDKALEKMRLTRLRWNALAAQRSQPNLEEMWFLIRFFCCKAEDIFKPIIKKDNSPERLEKERKLLEKYSKLRQA